MASLQRSTANSMACTGSNTNDEEIQDRVREVLRYRPVPVCEQAAQLHPSPFMESGRSQHSTAETTPEWEAAAKEASRQERRRVIAANKECDAAEPVRRAWVRGFLQRKTAPTGAMAFITTELLHGAHPLRQALDRTHPLAADLFALRRPARSGTARTGSGKRSRRSPTEPLPSGPW
jgi:ParB family transcriptional regulator, chromosome partitioning protein